MFELSPTISLALACQIMGLAAVAGPKTQAVSNGNSAELWPALPAHKAALADAERSVADAAQKVAHDRFRPAFHFVPAGRFMNDPNGCVQFQGAFHMFYQHLPYWGVPKTHQAPGWGHAVSRDLVRWQHLPIALMPLPGTYDSEAIASGACVVADGQPTIVYTSVPPQAQSLARSTDGMLTWHRYARNPVLTRPTNIDGLEDGFRDPFVWREGNTWSMVVGSGIRNQGGAVLLYKSADLISWEFIGPLCVGMGPDCFQWECPNFFRLGKHWVLVVSPLLHSLASLRGPVQYAVGTYDGRHFEPGEWHLLDLGGPSVFYAPNSLETDHHQRIMWGWLMGGGEPGMPWDGMLTVARRLELGPDLRLRVSPVDQLKSLRREPVGNVSRRELEVDQHVILGKGNQLDAEIELTRQNSGRLEFGLFCSANGVPARTVTYDFSTGELRCDAQAGRLSLGKERTIKFRLLVDRSVVEVYADSREVMSLRMHPGTEANELHLAARQAPLHLVRAKAWAMNSIWP